MFWKRKTVSKSLQNKAEEEVQYSIFIYFINSAILEIFSSKRKELKHKKVFTH